MGGVCILGGRNYVRCMQIFAFLHCLGLMTLQLTAKKASDRWSGFCWDKDDFLEFPCSDPIWYPVSFVT